MQRSENEQNAGNENFTDNSRVTVLGAANRPLTTEKYRPQAPAKWERRMSLLRQALCLPKTLLTICKTIREDFSTAALDENLWSFWGFHQEVVDREPWDPHYRARQWEKVQLGAIGPQHVTGGLAVWEMALMMNIAMENEDPILEYSQQSGEGFRFLLPTMGRFMGKNEEQARYSAEHGIPWCEGVWCAEERRHSNAFARIIERLVHVSPSRDNPNHPMVVTADEASAVRHIISRQTTEWNASSSYIAMAAHTTGDLRTLVRNIIRDEIKHLSIISSADSYLFGPRLWRRLLDVVKLGMENYGRQRKGRSGGALLGGNPALAVEGIISHILTALYLTKWLRTVPLRTLTTVFETPSKLPELAAFAPSPERQIEIEETLRKGEDKRWSLDRWDRKSREAALARRSFDQDNARMLEKIIIGELNGFYCAEAPGSRGDKKVRRRIARISRTHKQQTMVRACLLDRLRHYQIRNNRHVRGRKSFPEQASQRALIIPELFLTTGGSGASS